MSELRKLSDSVSRKVEVAIREIRRRKWSAFTLAELIIVIAILAVLATVGFIALSGYSTDAKASAIKANVRSVYSAIISESAITGNSPRFFIVHDDAASLSGGIVFVDSVTTALTGGAWNTPNTNYSAGNPDYPKLKLNPEKFKTGFDFKILPTHAAYDSKYLTVGAAEIFQTAGRGTPRPASFVQVAGISSSDGGVHVVGNYPVGMSGSVAGLIRDPKNPSLTGALTEGTISTTTGGGFGAPAGLSRSNLTQTGLTLNWNSVPTANSYEVWNGSTMLSGSVTGTSFQVTGLSENTTYTFSVKAKNAETTSAPSSLTVKTPRPTAVCGVTNIAQIQYECPVGCSTVGTACGGGFIAGENLVVARSGCAADGTSCSGVQDSVTKAWKTDLTPTPFSESLTNGYTNTEQLTATPSLRTAHPAATYCADMTAYGYDDWYLPSSAEIDKVKSGKDSGILTGFATSANVYWTSSQVWKNKPYTWNIGWNNITSGDWNQTTILSVRCTRRWVNEAVCGAANSTPSYLFPSDGACAGGSLSVVDSTANDGNYDWNCVTPDTGASVSCSAPKKPAVCGSTDERQATFPCPVGCSTMGTLCGGGTIVGANVIVSRSGCNASGTSCAGTQDNLAFAWKTTNTSSTGASSMTDGQANTTALTLDATLRSQHPAATYCEDMTSDGFTDWHLPAHDEILKMKAGKDAGALSGFATSANVYWTSTQVGTNKPYTWNIGWNNVTSGDWSHTTAMSVRCVRSF